MYNYTSNVTDLPVTFNTGGDWAKHIQITITAGATVTLSSRAKDKGGAFIPAVVLDTAGIHTLPVLRDVEYRLTIANNTGAVSLG